MRRQGWLLRLWADLPGWSVWHSSGCGVGTSGYYAVPTPDDTPHSSALEYPNRLGPCREPQDLRSAARQRYGWHDTCESCGVLARDCGHRGPESRVRDGQAPGPPVITG